MAQSTAPAKKAANRTERSYSRPVAQRKLLISTVNVHKVYNRSYEFAINGLFNLEAVLPIITDDKESLQKLMDSVQALITDCGTDFSNRTSQYQKLLDDNGITSLMEYTNSRSIEFTLYSPMAGQLVSLFKAADDLIIVVDTLWMNGVFTAIQRKDAMYEVQQRLSRLCGRVGGMSESAYKAARRAGREDVSDLIKRQDADEIDDEAREERDAIVGADADINESTARDDKAKEAEEETQAA